MPLPILGAAAAALGTAGLQAGANALTQYSNNANNINMYNRVRKDNIADWERDNDIKGRIQRYKDAGLSPHLIYGQASQTTPVKSAPLQSAQRENVQVQNPLQQAQIISSMQTQTLQNKQIAAQTEGQSIANETAQQDLNIKQQFDALDRIVGIEYKTEQVTQIKESIQNLSLTNKNLSLNNEILTSNVDIAKSNVAIQKTVEFNETLKAQYLKAELENKALQAKLTAAKTIAETESIKTQIQKNKAEINHITEVTKQVTTMIDLNKQLLTTNQANFTIDLQNKYLKQLTDLQTYSQSQSTFGIKTAGLILDNQNKATDIVTKGIKSATDVYNAETGRKNANTNRFNSIRSTINPFRLGLKMGRR